MVDTPPTAGFYEVFVRITDPNLGFLETKLFNLEVVAAPPSVTIPLVQHIGAPNQALTKPRQQVAGEAP